MQNEKKLYLIKILTDICEGYLLEIAPNLREREKMICSRAIKSNKQFTKMFDTIIHDAEQFGEVVDKVKQQLESEVGL